MYPNYPTQPGQPPYGGYPQGQNNQMGFNTGYPQQPGYPSGGYPQQPGYPSSGYPQQQGYPSGGYPQQPGYPTSSAGNSGLFDAPSAQAQPGYLPAHIANNPNFQPSNQNYQNFNYGNFQQPTAPQPQQNYPDLSNFQNPGYAPQPGYANQSYGQSIPVGNPTLRPFQPFNPNDDAAKLYKAMKGFGTDETTLIDILCRRTFQQRQEISRSYKASYGKDLLKKIIDETGGNFELLFKALLQPSAAHLDANDLMHGIDGIGTNETMVTDIICTKSNAEMNELKNAFRQMYGKDLEREVGGEASGYFKRFLVSLITANRSEVPPDPSRAHQQAQELYQAGENRVGTNETVFNRIFATESFPQLRLIFENYYRQTGHDIDKAIKTEMSGDVERAFLAVANVAKNPAAYWATRLYESMIGAGTHDRNLIRIMVQRSEKDMQDIKQQFQSRYGKTLESCIKNDCSGDYKRGLLCLAGDQHWR